MNEAPIVISEFRFGRFRLVPAQQALFKDETPIRLGSRALDLLQALVERPGEIIARDELMARIWPDTSVADANLKVQVAALRRALGDGSESDRFVATSNGRGYRFVAPVERRGSLIAASPTSAKLHNLPSSWTPPLGRDDVIDRLARDVPAKRFITIVGPGGIGKTTVAIALARTLIDQYRDGVWIIDLAALRDPKLLPGVIASTVGAGVYLQNGATALPVMLSDMNMLIVLDCCEHLVDAVARIVEDIVRQAPMVHVAATSREPLRAMGEIVERLQPLATPPDAPLTAAEALRFPAVELFVERAAAAERGFALTDANAEAVAGICRKLDGIALAIELAARRADAFAIPELLSLLSDRFRLLTRGRRTDLPRHQTLLAAIDWGFDLLPACEQETLRRLSMFAGSFTLHSALAVASEGVAPGDFADRLGALVSKSLVCAENSGGSIHYRLLDSIRAYALRQAEERDEVATLSRRHAEHVLALFLRAEREWERRPSAAWLDEHGRSIDDLRQSLDWAFSDHGDATLGAAMTAASIPIWTARSLVDECRRHMERALDARWPRDHDDGATEMKLSFALGSTLLQTQGPTQRALDAWRTTAEIAERLGDHSHGVQACWGLADYHTWRGEHRAALELTVRTREIAIAARDRAAEVNLGRQAGTALRYLGRLAEARGVLERMIDRYEAPLHWEHPARFQFDPRIAARGTLANVHWLQGRTQQAMSLAELALEDARRSGHALALCNAFAHTAIPVALYVGSWDRAQAWLEEFLGHTARQAMPVWDAIGRCLTGVLQIQQGRPDGVGLMRAALDEFTDRGFRMRRPAYLGALASGLERSGRLAEARAVVDEALASLQDERWCLGELLRIDANLSSAEGAPPDVVETKLLRSIQSSKEIEAFSFELRAVGSLSRLLRDQGRRMEADDLLAQVSRRGAEVFEAGDHPRPEEAALSPAVLA
ncbi:ATP-binding protein [Methylopila turkensis]|uniref:ATPase n=1 Tax=Methylopila turkensis TaxID=1437816 RepID=A0A9W6JMY2_9HYPH|nr:winged helix-turn-helix domain-containing protein [Methylopila turkensis]GLK79109.1 ATPase [Methylopila turkensis]